MSSRPRRPLIVALALVVVALLLPAIAAPVAAAEDPLRMSAATTYRVDPDDGVVRVRVDLTLTSLKPNSANYIYFYNGVTIGLQDQARKIKATSRGSTLRTSARERDGFDELSIRFPNLYYRQTRKIRLDFELPGGKPRSTSPIRVGAAFVAFTAWSWGDPGRATVTIRLPLGFTDRGFGAELRESNDDAAVILSSGTIQDTDDWYHVISAERSSALERIQLGTTEGPIVVHAWPEDAEWQTAARSTLTDGVPALQTAIGLDWPVDGDLDIRQVHTPLLEGYAGTYESSSDTISVSEDIDPQTILHEVAHAWFDSNFLDDRFLYEGLAETYSTMAATELGLEVVARDPVTPNDPTAFALRAWPNPEPIDDTAIAAREDFGYSASAIVMQRLLDETGVEGMRAVLQAVNDGTIAYAGDIPAERHPGNVDYRRFLDLVQEVGGADSAVEIYEAWVMGDQGRFVLRGRDDARLQYGQLLAAGDALEPSGDGWAAPTGIRRLMSEWRFDDARYRMNHATDVVEAWAALLETEATLGVAGPDDIEAPFEAAVEEDELTELTTAIGERVAAADAILAADATLAVEPPLEVQVGLLGEDVTLGVAGARAAYAAGDLPGVESGVATSLGLLGAAPETGRTRMAIAAAGLVGLLLLVIVAIWSIRRRRRRRRSAAPVTVVAGPAVEVDASSTLPATSDPMNPSEPGAPPD